MFRINMVQQFSKCLLIYTDKQHDGSSFVPLHKRSMLSEHFLLFCLDHSDIRPAISHFYFSLPIQED